MRHRHWLLLALALVACDGDPSLHGGASDAGSFDTMQMVDADGTPPADAALVDAQPPLDARSDATPIPDAHLPDAAPLENASCGHDGQMCCSSQPGPPGDVCANHTGCCYGDVACVGQAGTCAACGGLDEPCCPPAQTCDDPTLSCAATSQGLRCRVP